MNRQFDKSNVPLYFLLSPSHWRIDDCCHFSRLQPKVLKRFCRVGRYQALLLVCIVSSLLATSLHFKSNDYSNLLSPAFVSSSNAVAIFRSNNIVTSLELNHVRVTHPRYTGALVTSTPPNHAHSKASRHVIGRIQSSAGRLGNEMFVYASTIGIAERNKMSPVYKSSLLRSIFDIKAEETSPDELGPDSMSLAETSAFQKDSRFDNLATLSGGDVTLVGYFQSVKYFEHVRERIRQEFEFNWNLRERAKFFLRSAASSSTSFEGDTVYVGVHIRRDDMLHDYNQKKGYTVADQVYLQRAVEYMTDRLCSNTTRPLNIIFVVCSDDVYWSKNNFPASVSQQAGRNIVSGSATAATSPSGTLSLSSAPLMASSGLESKRTTPVSPLLFRKSSRSDETVSQNMAVRMSVIFSEGNSNGQDLAILSQCNHTIMTVGTFGWWAAYLAGGITVYYRNFPAAGSDLMISFSSKDFFPPEWIGL